MFCDLWHCVLCKGFIMHIPSGEEDSAVYGHLRNGTLDGIIHSQGYAVYGHGIWITHQLYQKNIYSKESTV